MLGKGSPLDEKNGNEGSFVCRNRAEKLRSTGGTNYMCLVSYYIVQVILFVCLE